MGFRIAERTVPLSFDEGHRYHGLEATLRLNVPMELMFGFMAFAEGASDMTVAEKRDVFRQFGDLVLENWNLEYEDGSPVPANGEGLLTQHGGFDLAGLMVRSWSQYASAQDDPFEQPSADGDGQAAPLALTASQ